MCGSEGGTTLRHMPGFLLELGFGLGPRARAVATIWNSWDMQVQRQSGAGSGMEQLLGCMGL